jgi:hypothetical protein
MIKFNSQSTRAMKSLITSIFLSLCLGAISQTQSLGLKTGLSWCNQSGSNYYSSSESIQRYLLSADYNYQFKSKLKVGVGVSYAPAGFKVPLIFTDQAGNVINNEPLYMKFTHDYISIPIKVGYEFGNKLFGYGDIGIAPSFLIKAERTNPTFDENLQHNGEVTIEMTDQYAPIEFGGVLDLGIGYKLSDRYSLFVEGNFYQGLTTITTDNYFIDKTIFNSRSSALIGIRYTLK